MSSSAARKNRRMRLKHQSQDVPLQNISKTESLDPSNAETSCQSDTGKAANSILNSQSESHSKFYGDTSDTTETAQKEIDINPAERKTFPVVSRNNSNSQCELSSNPTGKIFIEEDSGFRVVDADQFVQSSHLQCLKIEPKRKFAIHLAYVTSKHFHSFSNFCHGLLGGLSLLQCLILYHLFTCRPVDSDIIEHYSFIAKPVHNLFNFLCIICCVSAFDRYDIGNPKCLWKHIVGCKLKLLVVILYPVCLILSFTAVNLDDKLTLSRHNSSIWESLSYEDIENEIFYWKALTIAKCVGSVICWMIIAGEPNFNSFLKHVESIAQICRSTP